MNALSSYCLSAADADTSLSDPSDWVYGALFVLIVVFVFWPKK